ncbi:hypothetical protein ABTL70_20140, partial [Acinetobacter baumannii]
MKTLGRWGFLVLAWSLLVPLGAAAVIMLPLNLVLVPCWLMMASSVGPLARELFGDSMIVPSTSAASPAAEASLAG